MEALTRHSPEMLDQETFRGGTPRVDMLDAHVAQELAPLREVLSYRNQLADISHEHPLFREALDSWVSREILDQHVVPENPSAALSMRISALEELIAELGEDGEEKELILMATKELDICKRYRDDKKLGTLAVVDTVHVTEPGTGFYL